MFNESLLGEYKCTASNPRGSTATLFHVTLGNKPAPPDLVSPHYHKEASQNNARATLRRNYMN